MIKLTHSNILDFGSTQNLPFKPHIDYIVKKAYGCLASLYRSINCFTFPVRKRLILQLILPLVDCADIVYQNTPDTHLKPLTVLFHSLCRFVLTCPFRIHHCFMFDSLNWLQPKSRRQFHWLHFLFKCVYFHCPPYLKELMTSYNSPYSLRHMKFPFFFVPRISKEVGKRSFHYKAPSDWNDLPLFLCSITSFHCFRMSLHSHLKQIAHVSSLLIYLFIHFIYLFFSSPFFIFSIFFIPVMLLCSLHCYCYSICLFCMLDLCG